MNKVRCWGDILLLNWMVLDGLLVVWSAFLKNLKTLCLSRLAALSLSSAFGRKWGDSGECAVRGKRPYGDFCYIYILMWIRQIVYCENYLRILFLNAILYFWHVSLQVYVTIVLTFTSIFC